MKLLSKKLTNIGILLILLPFSAMVQNAYADNNVQNTQENPGQTQNTTVSNTVPGNPEEWGLNPQEWAQYQQLMKGRDGLWYPKLTPPEVLGMSAKTPQEQQHFANIVAKEEHDKLAREIIFNNAVHGALLRLYPNEPLIRPFDLSPYNPIKTPPVVDAPLKLQSGDHIVLFEDIQKDSTSSDIPVLLKTLNNHAGVTLDVFCISNPNKENKENKNQDAAIQAWAKHNKIPVDLVNQGRVTLNHNNGKFQKLGQGISLPYLLIVHSGNSKPISLVDLES